MYLVERPNDSARLCVKFVDLIFDRLARRQMRLTCGPMEANDSLPELEHLHLANR